MTRSSKKTPWASTFLTQVGALTRKHVLTLVNSPIALFLSLTVPVLLVAVAPTTWDAIMELDFGSSSQQFTEELTNMNLEDCRGLLLDCRPGFWYTHSGDGRLERVGDLAGEILGLDDDMVRAFESEDDMYLELAQQTMTLTRRSDFAAVLLSADEDTVAYQMFDFGVGLGFEATRRQIIYKQAIDEAIMASARAPGNIEGIQRPDIQMKVGALPTVLRQLTKDDDVDPSLVITRGIQRLLADLVVRLMWAVTYIPQALVIATIISEDKHNGLLSPLRKVGMVETAYWTSIMVITIVMTLMSELLAFIPFMIQKSSFVVYEVLGADVFLIAFLFYGIALTLLCSLPVSMMPTRNASDMLKPFIVVLLLAMGLVFLVETDPKLFQNPDPTLRLVSKFLTLQDADPTGFGFASLVPSFSLFVIYEAASFVEKVNAAEELTEGSRGSNALTLSSPSVATLRPGVGLDAAGYAPTPAHLQVLVMFGLIVLFQILNWYFLQVVGGQSGSGRSWIFFLKMFTREKGTTDAVDKLHAEAQKEGAIALQDFSKMYGRGRKRVVAVKNISVTFARGTVTALLGHNGAGKTSIIEVLSGKHPLTSGHFSVFGTSDRRHIQNHLGVCAQHDAFWKSLSAYEHLRLFARFRGIPREVLDDYIRGRLIAVGLEDVANKRVVTFSGGMKRRITLVTATIGDPSFIILDEPTTGMDPLNKRKVWAFISSIKKEAAIIWTTHSMEEAEKNADAIVIMHQGEIKASGTSLSLRNALGTGYQVGILTDAQHHEKVVQAVQTALPGCETISSTPGTLTVAVPKELTERLPHFLRDIQLHQFVRKVDIRNASLEQVFHRIAGAAESDAQNTKTSDDAGDTATPLVGQEASGMMDKHFEWKTTFWTSVYAIVLRHFTFYSKQKKTMIAFFLMLVIIGACMIVFQPETTADEFCPDGRRKIEGQVSCDNESLATAFSNAVETCSRSNSDPCQVPDWNIERSLRPYSANPELPSFGSTLPDIPSVVWIDGAINTFLSNARDAASGNITELNQDPSETVRENQNFVLSQAEPSGTCPWWRVDGLDSVVQEFQTRFPDATVRFTEFDVDSLNVVFELRVWSVDPESAEQMVAIVDQQSGNECLGIQLGQQGDGLAALKTLQSGVNAALYRSLLEDQDGRLQFASSTLETGTNLVLGLFLIFLTFFMIASLFSVYAIMPWHDKETDVLPYLRVNGVSELAYWSGQYLGQLALGCVAILVAIVCFLIVAPSFPIIPLLLATLLLTHCTIGFSLFFSAAFPPGAFTRNVANLMPLVSAIPALIPFFTAPASSPMPVSWLGTLYPPLAFMFTMQMAFEAQPDVVVYAVPMVEMLLMGTAAIFAAVGISRFKEMGYTLSDLLVRLQSRKRKSDDWNIERNIDKSDTGDEDVLAHEQLLRSQSDEELRLSYSMVSVDLTKDFGGFKAVDQLCLGLEAGESFGLLGPNGAGKTTALNVFMGVLPLTSGKAFLGGVDIHWGVADVLGVCPQFDKVSTELTVEENLLFFARVHGVTGKTAKILALDSAKKVGLGAPKVYSRRAGALSGGMRRRLSIAIALLGNNKLLFLDEPSTGLDPATRLRIWDIINGIKKSSTSTFVITTHSMEEADTLCSRIGIMAGGKLRCIGNQLRLKARYGDGYTLTVQLRATIGVEDIKTAMHSIDSENSPAVQAEMKAVEEFETYLKRAVSPTFERQFMVDIANVRRRVRRAVNQIWTIPNVIYVLPPDVDLASAFERLTHASMVQEFDLNQSSLEDVFVKVASPFVR